MSRGIEPTEAEDGWYWSTAAEDLIRVYDRQAYFFQVVKLGIVQSSYLLEDVNGRLIPLDLPPEEDAPQHPEANRVISPAPVCTSCGSENVEDGQDPEWASWEAVDASLHCKDCGASTGLSYALVDTELLEEGEP